MNLGLYKNLTFNSGKVYPYATGGDYVYLYEEGNKTYRVHEFLSTGTSTLNVEVGGQMDILVVGGGGGGGQRFFGGGGGGGAGGVVTLNSFSVPKESCSVIVGKGGTAAVYGGDGARKGEKSSFTIGSTTYTAEGGGLGGGYSTISVAGGTGGCGGGGAWVASGGSGTTGQGKNGGSGNGFVSGYSGCTRAAGGGGGAGQPGESPATPNTNTCVVAGKGGDGIQWLNGKYYGGGGGGGVGDSGSGAAGGSGGLGGGGGGGGNVSTNGSSGSPNTGGGGGGGRDNGGNGGSGIVIVRYVVAEKKLWTPSELGSSLQGWWDFSDTSTLYGATSGGSNVTENDSEILRVEDKSGNGIHLPKATNITSFYTGNIAPNILKTNAQNGLSVFEVDKVNNPNPNTYIGGGFGTQNVPIGSNVSSLAAIWVDYAGGNVGQYYGGVFKLSDGVAANGGNYRLTQDWPDSTTVHLWRGMAGNDSTSTLLTHNRVNYGSGAWRINIQNANYTQPTNSLRIFVNGNTTPSAIADSAGFTSNTISGPAKFLQIGQSTFSNQQANYARGTSSKLGEIMFISEDLVTDIQTRQKLEGYLAHKWGLTNNLPAGHPYKYEPPYKVEPEEIVTDGLVLNLDAGDYASYPRSGTTWYDISGNGLNGTLTNGPTYDSENKGSIVTDGSDDYILVGRIPYTSSGTQSVTWSLWTKPSSTSGNIMSMSSTNPQGGWNMPPISASGQKFIGKIWSNSQLFSSTYSLDTWYNLTLVWNYSTTSSERGQFFYVNGELVGSQTNISYSASNASGGNFHFLGQSNPGANNTGMYSGKYGQFCVYNRALSSTEITQNFNALRGRYGI